MGFYYAGGPKGVYLYHITINVINELSHSTPFYFSLSPSISLFSLAPSSPPSIAVFSVYLPLSIVLLFVSPLVFLCPCLLFHPPLHLFLSLFSFSLPISPTPLSFLAPSFSPLTHILENGLFLLINIMFYLFCVLIDAFSFFSQY